MGVVWCTTGAQERYVLLELGQGRTVGEGLLNLARVFVLGSHGNHLLLVAASCAWRRRLDKAERPWCNG
jgi:hypothetical protein